MTEKGLFSGHAESPESPLQDNVGVTDFQMKTKHSGSNLKEICEIFQGKVYETLEVVMHIMN